jgi:hypothetical protein
MQEPQLLQPARVHRSSRSSSFWKARSRRASGLLRTHSEIESHDQDEVNERGEPGFAERAALWSEVIENVGAQIVQAGFCTGRNYWMPATVTAPGPGRISIDKPSPCEP